MIGELASSFPDFGLFSEKSKQRVGEKLALAGQNTKPGNYLSFSLFASIALSLLCFLFLLFSLEALIAVAGSLIAFSLSFLFLFRLPSILAKRRGKEIEADLSVAMRSFSAELGMGIPFESCLAHASEAGYAISPELKKALLEVKGGASVPEALRAMAQGVDSLIVKRATQQMIEAYRHGSKGEGLRHLANELIETQKAGAREHGAKVAFLGLLFVAASCIVPALFQAYAIVGASFLSSSFSPLDIWLAYLFVFPLAGGTILFAIYEGAPKSMAGGREGLATKKQGLLADRALKARGISLSFKKIVSYSLAAATGLSLLMLMFSFLLGYEPWLALIPFMLPMLAYFLVVREVEARASELEARLPDALLMASSFPKGTPTEKVMGGIAEGGYGALSEEFASAYGQVKAGSDVPSALRGMAEDNGSALLLRACGLLSQAYSSGGDMQRAMKETAEDMFAIFSIVRERESTLALQKYTLLFGGAVIVPVVLGTISNAVSGLSTTGLEFISSTGPAERGALMGAAMGAGQAYLVIYSLLASLYIAQLSGSFRNFAPYFIGMAPFSLLAYNVALRVNLLSG